MKYKKVTLNRIHFRTLGNLAHRCLSTTRISTGAHLQFCDGKKRISEKWWPENSWLNTVAPPSTSTTTLTMASKLSSILSPLFSLFSKFAFLRRFSAPFLIAFQVLKFQLFSLTSIPPDQQKVLFSSFLSFLPFPQIGVYSTLHLIMLIADTNWENVFYSSATWF